MKKQILCVVTNQLYYYKMAFESLLHLTIQYEVRKSNTTNQLNHLWSNIFVSNILQKLFFISLQSKFYIAQHYFYPAYDKKIKPYYRKPKAYLSRSSNNSNHYNFNVLLYVFKLPEIKFLHKILINVEYPEMYLMFKLTYH